MTRSTPRASTRKTAEHGLQIPDDAVTQMRAELASVADNVVAAIIDEVPSYTDAFSGPMGETIRNAVQLALGGFLSLASGKRGVDQRTPAAPAVEGAYQLGRGEARSGRSTDALLSAYRIGARVSWHELSLSAVRNGVDGEVLVDFAGLVFAYIDELSAASVAGHTDETETTGRVRQRLLARVAQLVLNGAPEPEVVDAAERAGWKVPTSLTAVLVPEAQVRPVLASVSPATLEVNDVPDAEPLPQGWALLLVPGVHPRRRGTLLRILGERGSLAGPTLPWTEVRASYERVRRAHALGIETDTEAHLPRLVLHADEKALGDLRARALEPLTHLRPAAAEKLADTLRAWLLLQGRRDEVAAVLFVHPQTVRYRMGQLRELYGDRLEDPDAVLELVLALA